ncbi:MAG: bifunctional riboflavin kinase/FAD synthetase [Candidatus Gastranaerophilales bacterium]|nr:bifunctional riboflavin kinase/FAD synthetase [Candidatus Gastranaerophilales bacterium]
MQIFNEIDINKGLSLAFGFFDGVHLGHQAVIKSAVNFARKNNTKSAIITFHNHPCCFFYHVKPKYLIKKHTKIELFEKMGVDYLYFLQFDEYLAMMNASDYLKDVIIKHFAPAAISTGFNYFFGANKSGNTELLCTMQNEFCYKYFEIPPVMFNNEVISSTAIRENLSHGNIELVNSMLGYNYFVEEIVVLGQQLGRELGFKTANLIYPNNLIEIGKGVYKATVDYKGKNYTAIANYGTRPTLFHDKKPVLEVHLLDFDENIYNETIKVNFIKKIREEKKFHSVEELKTQIKEDIDKLYHI